MVTWDLRIRTARGTIEDSQIQTYTSREEEARELAECVIQGLATPSARFVYVKPAVSARSSDFPELVKKYADDAEEATTPRRASTARVGV